MNARDLSDPSEISSKIKWANKLLIALRDPLAYEYRGQYKWHH